MRCLEPLVDDMDSFVYLNCLLALKQLAHFCFFHNYGTDRRNAALTAFLRELTASYSEGGKSGRHRAMLGELLLLVLRMARAADPRSTPLPSLLALRSHLPSLKEICLCMAAARSDPTLIDDPLAPAGVEVDIRRSMTLNLSAPPARCESVPPSCPLDEICLTVSGFLLCEGMEDARRGRLRQMYPARQRRRTACC